ncbi:glutathione S-transferase C-terminal domain-containing protein homolog [Ctenocephalides felis]|uniref:glutathione S-transferase C-terminal domain-containing protein homolog n=1 Tax=Ctenocephalides felis TaxID=7515 RepID=UPI000E6E56F7|nr:glutathione S-transferase C-terminal domain-containing protein homolog [Ctenocephalides felis]
MAKLYIQVFVQQQEHECFSYHVSLESVITLFTYKYCNSKILLYFVKSYSTAPTFSFGIDLLQFNFNWLNETNLEPIVKSCALPIILIGSNAVVAGLCSVSRKIVMLSQQTCEQENIAKLLGFKNACLMSPNEASMWTKFCEIDMISALKSVIQSIGCNFNNGSFSIPKDVARFEHHLGQPVRLHNIYKVAQDLLKDKKITSETVPRNLTSDSGAKVDQFPLTYKYAEGIEMTLSDVIIFPYFYILFHYVSLQILSEKMPLIINWYKQISLENDGSLMKSIKFLHIPQIPCEPSATFLPSVEGYSLYKSNPKHYKCRNKNYTKQNDIDNVLKLLANVPLDIKKSVKRSLYTKNLDWNSLPFDALPEGGHLPEKRRVRKFQQLENLAKAAIEIAKPGDHIIDFCSGSGHLGIIIAFMLPQCHISLLENKEESMNRAKSRVSKLGLNNVSFFQCNLDFFKGEFQIGVSLHACGVATDLVMQHCIEREAKFICCPCCYGSVHQCHHLEYPRSKVYKEHLKLHEYLILGHGADQTHDAENAKTAQGEICMDFIDKDRILYAQEFGYNVILQKLDPPTCTPKNNLLIGLKQMLE